MTTLTNIELQEDKEYRLRLCRTGMDETLGLYAVVMPPLPAWYVLADSEEAAISQASCAKDFPRTKDNDPVSGAFSKRIPLLLRGWGKQQF